MELRKSFSVPFICDTLDEKPTLSEHVSYKWVAPEELPGIDFSEADIPVALAYLGTKSEAKTG